MHFSFIRSSIHWALVLGDCNTPAKLKLESRGVEKTASLRIAVILKGTYLLDTGAENPAGVIGVKGHCESTILLVYRQHGC
jgi:hypothetical protein